MAIAAPITGAPTCALFTDVTAFLNRHRIPESRFGRDALRDPAFVRDMRIGRTPSAGTERRVRSYMARLEGC